MSDRIWQISLGNVGTTNDNDDDDNLWLCFKMASCAVVIVVLHTNCAAYCLLVWPGTPSVSLLPRPLWPNQPACVSPGLDRMIVCVCGFVLFLAGRNMCCLLCFRCLCGGMNWVFVLICTTFTTQANQERRARFLGELHKIKTRKGRDELLWCYLAFVCRREKMATSKGEQSNV